MAGPFVPRFRGIVEPLFGRSFTESDGISEAELDAIPSRCGYELPEVLQDFYAVVGHFESVISAHNRFYAASDFIEMDGKLVFCEENQVVVFWAYDQDQERQTDPPVYQGVNNDEIEWYAEAARMSYFLAGMIYWQALFGGLPECRSCEAPESIRQAAAGWPLVWADETTQLFSRGPIVFSLTSRERSVEVMASGLSEAALAELWRVLGL